MIRLSAMATAKPTCLQRSFCPQRSFGPWLRAHQTRTVRSSDADTTSVPEQSNWASITNDSWPDSALNGVKRRDTKVATKVARDKPRPRLDLGSAGQISVDRVLARGCAIGGLEAKVERLSHDESVGARGVDSPRALVSSWGHREAGRVPDLYERVVGRGGEAGAADADAADARGWTLLR